MTVRDEQQRLAQAVLARALDLDGENLQVVAHVVGRESWQALTQALMFSTVETGGGMSMLVAELAGTEYVLGMTDGEAELPRSAERFYMGVMEDADGYELYSMAAEQDRVTWRGGQLMEEGLMPVKAPDPLL